MSEREFIVQHSENTIYYIRYTYMYVVHSVRVCSFAMTRSLQSIALMLHSQNTTISMWLRDSSDSVIR